MEEWLSVLIGAFVGGGMALLGSFLAMRKQTEVAHRGARLSELQYLTPALSLAYQRWRRDVLRVSEAADGGTTDAALLELEWVSRSQLMSWRMRLGMEDDIGRSIDRALFAYMNFQANEWLAGKSKQEVVEALFSEQDQGEWAKVREALDEAFLATSVELPGRIAEAIQVS